MPSMKKVFSKTWKRLTGGADERRSGREGANGWLDNTWQGSRTEAVSTSSGRRPSLDDGGSAASWGEPARRKINGRHKALADLFDRGYTEKDDVLTTLAPRIREMDERHLDTTVGRMPMRLVHDEGSDTGSSFSARNRSVARERVPDFMAQEESSETASISDQMPHAHSPGAMGSSPVVSSQRFLSRNSEEFSSVSGNTGA